MKVISKNALFAVVFVSCGLLLSACDLGSFFAKSKGGAEVATPAESPAANAAGTIASNVITYSDTGFSPSSVKVKVGETVEFKNTSQVVVLVNSAVHPIHTLYPELNLDDITPGQSKPTSFIKPGTYKYHNHINASQNGEIVVE